MKAEVRRRELFSILKNRQKPITGSELAEEFNVSRQVIVQDIALLRAGGKEILATSQGYIMPDNKGMKTVETTIACRHSNKEVRDELMTIVNYGAKVTDVIVEHPIYGELRGILMIQSPADVNRFMEKYCQQEVSLLSALTGGVHLHTVQAMNETVIKRLKVALEKKGYLLEQD